MVRRCNDERIVSNEYAMPVVCILIRARYWQTRFPTSSSPGASMGTHLRTMMEQGFEAGKGQDISEILRSLHCRANWSLGVACPGLCRVSICANVPTPGAWTQKINNAYKYGFEVGVRKICDRNGPRRPAVPICRPWVRVFDIEDVMSEDVEKFPWESSSE
jgi:hypothetical protein